MSEIYVVGIDSSGVSAERKELMQRCELIVCSARLAGLIGESGTPIVSITPLQDAFVRIEEALNIGNVVVLASGDPLFYGIGDRLIQHFGKEKITFVPALSSMQEAFARFRIPWNDANIVSLHGRSEGHIPKLLLGSKKTFVFTDRENTPDRLSREILDYLELIEDEEIKKLSIFHVAENLGSADEKITTGTLIKIAESHFTDLNVCCIELPQNTPRFRFGLGEDDITHSRGLITKDEVRAATLHRLQLPQEGVFWDIGGGSGSLSIEAASMNPLLTVYTVERKDEELNNIKENIRRFACFNIIPVAGKAIEQMKNLPDPNVVFVGGSGGELEQIVRETAARLPKDGRLVVNGVTQKTITQAPQLMQEYGFSVETSKLTVSRTGPGGPVSFNPITIMVGRK